MITVGDIYDYIDTFAPFNMQQSYDNSGICAGERTKQVHRVLTSLDITCDVVREAKKRDCELIISHHPVIFHPLRSLTLSNPAVMVASMGMAAICMHTSFDSARGGMNDILAQQLGLEILDVLEYDEGKPIGYVCKLRFECSAAQLAALCKSRLGCNIVRYIDSQSSISKVGILSGSGGSALGTAIEKGCDALITGDVKHGDFVDASNKGFCLIDAGHYYTENIFHTFLAEKLAEEFPELVINRAESGRDPVTVLK
ncbi:MAG: Nif3-like dinuclear metal center hexameric protein [Ruminococcus sp.]|nr:Nif3-like dinuclear metal center hexameric protein [Ruminococcus sp.]